jgi:hypothetical protein
MWSDTLLAAERVHLIRLFLWAAGSAALGTLIMGVLTFRRIAAPILAGFAIQALAWGVAELILVTASWRILEMRDVSAATRLDRFTWFTAGLDVGIAGVGIAIAVLGWMHGRRLGTVGAGLGMLAQGLGLLVLQLTFASALARLV